jgi:hypothetical protein
MIRQAEAKDVPALCHLYHQLVRSVAPDTMVDVREDRIEQIRTDPHNFLFVLEMKDRICGTAFLTLCLDPLYRYQPYAPPRKFRDRSRATRQRLWDEAGAVRGTLLPAGGLLENHVARQQQAF